MKKTPKTLDDLTNAQIEQYADHEGLNIETTENWKEARQALFESLKDKKTKKRFVYFSLEEQNGERSYKHKLVRQLPKGVSATNFVKNMAKEWYPMGSPSEKTSLGYEFDYGDVIVNVGKVEQITEADFNILNKYL